MVFEAARHSPSAANAQLWHYIVVTDLEVKKTIANYFVQEARKRAKLKIKFPTPNYRGPRDGAGVYSGRCRFPKRRPSTMSAHLAAAALGYQV